MKKICLSIIAAMITAVVVIAVGIGKLKRKKKTAVLSEMET